MPRRIGELYWLSRTTLIDDFRDIETFDRVFSAVFTDTVLPLDPNARRTALTQPRDPEDTYSPTPGRSMRGDEENGGGLPWATLPAITGVADEFDDTGDPIALPERIPSQMEQLADVPFEEMDESDLALVGRWVETALSDWPQRRTRRRKTAAVGHKLALRRTLELARRTGYEPVRLVRHKPVMKPRRIVMICDVSQSMRAYTSTYLHVMRALAVRGDAEIFAFSTGLTRLTTTMKIKSTEAAIAQANAIVGDRFGGTRIATNIRGVLRSHYGNSIRGSVVIIASDGWDSDDPDQTILAMAGLRRRAHRVIWLNPRVAAPGYQPLVGAMAAAMPYCDDIFSGHSTNALQDAFASIAGIWRTG